MKLPKITLILAVLAIPFGATAAERLFLQTPVQYMPDIRIMARTKAECDIERHMADDAVAGITKRYGPVELAAQGDPVGNDKVLKLTIVAVDGIGGGQWTGAKTITVLAELKQGENELGTKAFSRSSSHSPFGGTCDMFHKVTKAIGSDIGVWLKRGPAAEPAQATE